MDDKVKARIFPPVGIHRKGKYEGQIFTITYKVEDMVEWILNNYHQPNELASKKGYFDIVISDDNRLFAQAETNYLNIVDGKNNPYRPQSVINKDIKLRWIKDQKKPLDL